MESEPEDMDKFKPYSFLKHEPKSEEGTKSTTKTEQNHGEKNQDGPKVNAAKKTKNGQNLGKRFKFDKTAAGSLDSDRIFSNKQENPTSKGRGRPKTKVKNSQPSRKKRKVEQLPQKQKQIPAASARGVANPKFRKLLKNMQKFNPAAGFTMFTCRTIKIGSFKIPPILGVTIQPTGILFQVLHPQTNTPILCGVPAAHIVSLQGHLSPRLPVLFIETSTICADWLRSRLGLSDVPGEPNFFCPVRGGPTEKRIILFPIKFNSLGSADVKKILVALGLVEVDFKTANEILVESTPDPVFTLSNAEYLFDSVPLPNVTDSPASSSVLVESWTLTTMNGSTYQTETSSRRILVPPAPGTNVPTSIPSASTASMGPSSGLAGYWWNNEWKWKNK